MKRLLPFLLLLTLLIAACGGNAETPSDDADADTDTDAAATTETEDTAAPEASEEPTDDAEETTPSVQEGGMVEAITSRGDLICGVNNTLPGFGNVDSAGDYTGFDVDFCKAIAAAILGDAEAVEYRPLTAQERFTAVQSGEVDVLIRNTTHTLTRDADVGLDFGPTTFYDGQGMMVRTDLGVSSLEEMDGATICVQTGTTTELNLETNFRALGLDYEPVIFQENDQLVAAYDAGQCDGFTTDKSGLVSSRTKLANPDEHVILDVTMSKEPLGPSVLQGDAAFADIVNWVVWGTFQAEEFGITSENVGEMVGSEDPEVLRFLGVEGDLGDQLGIPADFMVKVIEAVGNYEEIYNRNLGPDTPFELPRGQNALYTDGGLLYSPPFR